MIDISPEAVEALATILESQNDYFTAPKLRALRAALTEAEAAQAAAVAAAVGRAAQAVRELPKHVLMNTDQIRAIEYTANYIVTTIEPTGRAALADARETALREAAGVVEDEIDMAKVMFPQCVPILRANIKAILALIPRGGA